MNLQIDTKLDYPEGNSQLHFTGHNLFAFLWIQGIFIFISFYNLKIMKDAYNPVIFLAI